MYINNSTVKLNATLFVYNIKLSNMLIGILSWRNVTLCSHANNLHYNKLFRTNSIIHIEKSEVSTTAQIFSINYLSVHVVE